MGLRGGFPILRSLLHIDREEPGVHVGLLAHLDPVRPDVDEGANVVEGARLPLVDGELLAQLLLKASTETVFPYQESIVNVDPKVGLRFPVGNLPVLVLVDLVDREDAVVEFALPDRPLGALVVGHGHRLEGSTQLAPPSGW